MATQRLPEGAVLSDRYEILEIIGRGGMGTVYRALDRRIDTVVAVKEMTEKDVTSEERAAGIRQFEREAKLLGQLSHSNLPRVTDYFVEDERCYLVMEFVQGETLESRLNAAKGAPLPLADVLEWAVQLADTLVYLHSQDPPVVFRDIKPANIMVLADGSVKLIDFGIARRFQSGATKDTLLYGSPGYSPPEQYGRAQTDPRSDLYALAATLHHLATGRDPAPTPFKFPSIRSIDPTLPPALDTLLSRCVEMEVERRCQSSLEARDTLVQIRDALKVPASRPVPGPSGKITSPKIVSTRLEAVEQKRSVRRLLVGVGIVAVIVLIAVIGAKILPAARGSRPVAKPSDLPVKQPEAPKNDVDLSKSGTLRITSTPPGAVIAVDGKEKGRSPLDLTGIEAGKHTIKVAAPPDSGLGDWSREIEIRTGETVAVDAPLATRTTQDGAAESNATATIQDVHVQHVPAASGNEPGLSITATVRVNGAKGKPGAIGALFFAADKTTPLRAHADFANYRNESGQLSVASSFEAARDSADYPGVTLFVPEAAFPAPFDQVSWRVVVFVDGKPVGQSPIRPLVGQ